MNRFKEGAGPSNGNGLVEKTTDKDSDANFHEFVSSVYVSNTVPAK